MALTINDWLSSNTNRLQAAGIESARLDSLLLLENVLNTPRESLLASPNFELSGEQIAVLRQMTDRRVKNEPVAYILGSRDFYGLKFKVNRNVLVPRPETEILVEHIISNAEQGARVLDMGTGSGTIAVSLKVNRGDLEVSASEISKKALEVARDNAATHDAFIGFIQSDVFEQIKPQKQFDIIAANLPYVPLDRLESNPDLRHEPALALFPDEGNGLSLYERMFRDVKHYIKDDGWIIIEHDPAQLEDLLKLGKLARYNAESISEFVTKFSPIQTHSIQVD